MKIFLNPQGILYLTDIESGEVSERKNLKNTGAKINLYTIKDKITLDELNVIPSYSSANNNSVEKKFGDGLVHFLNDDIGKLLTDFCLDGLDVVSKKLIEELLAPALDNPNFSRRQEHLFCIYENDFLPIYNDILKKKNIPKKQNNPKCKYSSNYIKEKILGHIGNIISREINSGSDQKINFLDNSPNIHYFDLLHYIISQFVRTKKNILKFTEKVNMIL